MCSIQFLRIYLCTKYLSTHQRHLDVQLSILWAGKGYSLESRLASQQNCILKSCLYLHSVFYTYGIISQRHVLYLSCSYPVLNSTYISQGSGMKQTFKIVQEIYSCKPHLPGATTGDLTHDKVMWKKTVKQGFKTQGAPQAFSSIYPKTRICLFYYFMTFTNSSDINRGLTLTTFLWRKLTQGYS